MDRSYRQARGRRFALSSALPFWLVYGRYVLRNPMTGLLAGTSIPVAFRGYFRGQPTDRKVMAMTEPNDRVDYVARGNQGPEA